MNTEHDRLEAELRSLRPRDPSPELRQHIAIELAVQRQGHKQRTTAHTGINRRFLLASAALAASLLAVAFFIRHDSSRPSVVAMPLTDSPAATAFDSSLPTVWQFHHALNDQVNDLDTLLDQHAARAPAPALSLAQIRGFGPSDSNLKTLLGEF